MVSERLKSFGIAIIFLFGILVCLYPWISNGWNERHQSYMISEYEKELKKLVPESMKTMREAALAYNEKLIDNELRWNPTKDAVEAYNQCLNGFPDGVMGYIEVPDVEISLPIYHGTDDASLQVGAGHLFGSSLPVGGKGCHSVLVGHTGLPSALLFTRLDELEVKDMFRIRILNEDLYYEVDQILVVEPDDFSALDIDKDKDYCTLLTCTPYGVNSHRLLVRGHRSKTPSAYDEVEEKKKDIRSGQNIGCWIKAIIQVLPVLLLFSCMLMFIWRKILWRGPGKK